MWCAGGARPRRPPATTSRNRTPTAAFDPEKGIRQFVVGTGGVNFHGFGTVKANSEARNADTYGVLELTLHSSSYEWRFVPEAGGAFTDSGSTACH